MEDDVNITSVSLIEEATVEMVDIYGASEGEFKTRYNNHTKYFRTHKYEHDTELSKHLWSLKDRGVNYDTKWFIIAVRATPYKCGTRRCNLCLTEKVCIIRADENGLLNKRNELILKCRHRKKHLLSTLK